MRQVNGFVKEDIQELPMELAVGAHKLIGISLEGSVGQATPFGEQGQERQWMNGARTE